MEFNDDHKVIISTLTRIEAKAFIKFLNSEIVRHLDDVEQARKLIAHVEQTVLRGYNDIR